MDNTIQQTNDYGQFTLLNANRDTNRAHVERLMKEFEERGNLTSVQPILVNENFQIIDGQHRFLAAKELGAPVYFTVMQGGTVSEARRMNILHRQWGTDDYAKSYANSGDASYQRYQRLREDGMKHNEIMTFGFGETSGIYADFREGNMVLSPELETTILEKYNKLEEIRALMPNSSDNRDLTRAVNKLLKNESYDHSRMLQKLEVAGASIPSFATTEDYLRALEDVYNRNMSAENRVRLF